MTERSDPRSTVREGVLYFDVVVDGIDDEGRGRAVIDGWDFAIRGALPGDIAHIKIERSFPARSLSQARCIDFAAESDLHVERACPHQAPCAGCPLEGVDTGFVLALKRARVVQALIDAGLHDALALVDDVEPARSPRQKVKLTAHGATLGLYVPHSHALEDATKCAHQHPAITRALGRLQPVLRAHAEQIAAKAVVARAFVEGVGVVIVSERDVDQVVWQKLCVLVDDELRSIAVRVDDRETNSIVGGSITRSIGDATLTPLEGGPKASVDAFCQPDPELARHMYQRVARFLVDTTNENENGNPNETYVDAYAGAGGFSRALIAAGARDVIAIERASSSASSLHEIANVRAIVSSVEDALANGVLSASSSHRIAGMVADPPKKGLAEAAAPLASLNAKRVAIVACDPDAGARDAKVFVDAGYAVVGVEPIDLFPATPEVETVFLLQRASSSSSSKP